MNKKDQILKAAFSLLEEEGDASALNLRKIAKRAGCAHTNVYNYFPNFEALKWVMLEQALGMLDEFMFKSSEDEALLLISRYIDFALSRPALYRLIWVTELDPAAAPDDTDFLTRIPGRLEGAMDNKKADIVHCYLHGKLLNLIFSRYPAEDAGRQKEMIMKVCRAMLRK